jgi:hypothetical protein
MPRRPLFFFMVTSGTSLTGGNESLFQTFKPFNHFAPFKTFQEDEDWSFVCSEP